MPSTQAAPYGTWSSPITADAITKNAVTVSDILVDPITSTIYHIESRPSEKGRNIVVNTATGHDVTSGKEWDFRTGVHEYGGASAIVHGGIVYFSHYGNDGNGRVYRVKEGEEPEAVTPEGKAHRFAAFTVHPVYTHFLVAILEDHTVDEPAKIINTLCFINTRTKTVKSISAGADFYACPKFSPDGNRFAWQQWSHPDMPWEGAEVHIGDIVFDSDLNGFSIKNDVHVAGKPNDVSCGNLEWSTNGTLIFTSDESTFINPWKYSNGKSTPLFPKPVPQEFGSPMWTLDTFPYVILDKEAKYAIFIAVKDGRDELQLVDLEGGTEPQRIQAPYVAIAGLRSVSKENQEVVFIGKKADEKACMVKCTILASNSSPQATFVVIKSQDTSETTVFSKEIISMPQPLTIQGQKGDVHVVYYPPRNPQYSGSSIDGERPPCIVHVHGGPTGLQTQGLDWKMQYFTSRGWAWLAVNYGGSSGYGREYIKRLEGTWGEVDVEDTISAAKSISSAPYNLVDPKRMFIRGGSAGGWTVLCAVSYGSDRGTFAAGNAMYGVTELSSFVDGTHKFESKYLLKLVGVKGADSPEDQALLQQRSPVTHGGSIVVPLLVLQGGIDKVVPKQQADEMVKTITNAYVEYEVYPEEGHGWRMEKNIKAALEKELDFYERVLKLKGKSL